jgi:hypothetical protein
VCVCVCVCDQIFPRTENDVKRQQKQKQKLIQYRVVGHIIFKIKLICNQEDSKKV